MKPALDQESIIIGSFMDPENARTALRRLRDSGFEEEDIGLLARDQSGEVNVTTLDEARGSKSGSGAAIGAAAGAGGGALWALGVAAGVLPAIGPVIAGGLLTAVLASAAGGAAAGGVAGGLIGMGLSEEEASFYEDELRKGSTIVVVNAPGRGTEAMDILRTSGSYNRYEHVRETPR